LSHAMTFFDSLVERGVQPILKPIAEVPSKWNGTLHVME